MEVGTTAHTMYKKINLKWNKDLNSQLELQMSIRKYTGKSKTLDLAIDFFKDIQPFLT